MDEYVPAEIEIVMIETEDVITASGLLDATESGGNTTTYSTMVWDSTKK
jgi:hypothetical protein